MQVCQKCGSTFQPPVRPGRKPRKFCDECNPNRARFVNACERCGTNCKDDRCSLCKRFVMCSCGCGVEARLSSSDYGKSGVAVRAHKCLTREFMPESKKCEECGTSFAPTRQRQRFCCVDCAKGRSPERVCEVCGSLFRQRLNHGNVPRFCSRECAYEGRRRGLVILPKQAKKPPKAPQSRVYFPTCKMCRRLFCARSSRARYCSDECRYRVQSEIARQRGNGLYAAATEYVDGQYRGANYRKGLLAYLVERDGDRCGICRRKVNIALKSGTRGSRRGPSVDHIVPRSLGGTDDLANLRLTHWGCNQKRGNRGGNEQLALVG